MRKSNQNVIKITMFVFACLYLAGCATMSVQKPSYDYQKMDHATKSIHKKAEKFARNCVRKGVPVSVSHRLRVDSVLVNKQEKEIDVYYNWILGQVPYREENARQVYDALRKELGRRYRNYDLQIYSKKFPVEELVPNYYRSDIAKMDQTRMVQKTEKTAPIVRNISNPWRPTAGLYQRNIALWHSHGWYYENKLNRWEWQRARVFQIVEDLFPMSFTVPYLIPMLENAGANVFVPRERDFQTKEIIVDNDSSRVGCDYIENLQDSSIVFYSGADSSGFAIGTPPYESGQNPFLQGTYRYFRADTIETAAVEFVPDIPETGNYAVTIAYKSLANSIDDVRYTVFHTGGKTEFLVNQKIGSGTWIHLGTFKFKAGKNPETGKVIVSNKSQNPDGIITVDAVRFGGGMGNISRNGQISGRPRYAEAARYYLQYAGMPDTLVYNLNGDSIDYNDDYQCRGEWVNYLKGAPFGPTKNPDTKGLGIPVDLSLAFHTDAGKTRNDIVIGTLSIYNTDGADTTYQFPDGQSRLANRDLADILQTQIVDDIKVKYDPVWNRRALWDRGYSEVWRPNVPAVLLELLSHQNFLDMKFGNDPRFRFDVSRSIYKAFLRFIAAEYQTEYVVQPLPVDHFQALLVDKNSVRLKWRPTSDLLEPTAQADKYIVYTRIGDNGFDNGRLVNSNAVTFKYIKPGVIYSYKVTALNDGGESFPSEILSVCYMDSLKNPVLIVNGFDRIAPPATIETEKYLGFANFWDQGVPDGYDIGFIGEQYDFLDESRWLDDDSPGHGASYADSECKIVAGNTHDFVINHGKSIVTAGYSFVSVSDEAVMDGDLDITKYKVVDLIMGEEKLTDGPRPYLPKQFDVYPHGLQRKLAEYCQSGGNLFISGAYIATDPFIYVQDDSISIKFVKDNLKYCWRTNYAVKTGGVYSVEPAFMAFGESFQFNTELNSFIYAAEAPDAIEPVDSTAITILRYGENNTSAAVAYSGEHRVVAFGFPFETILNKADRDKVMRAVLTFFERK
ncbi:N-acetylmuramoyl-L-alanine amidase [bacterium]|nr:N-acetylmuramoyl-L-alanine amidase [bacterium]MBU1634378.1 N-acetylmuramoyl-L-alanine amidase [bacterium]MBU1875239.1 N-acetylmuramoyl-L-alanine amidase [bacterium]